MCKEGRDRPMDDGPPQAPPLDLGVGCWVRGVGPPPPTVSPRPPYVGPTTRPLLDPQKLLRHDPRRPLRPQLGFDQCGTPPPPRWRRPGRHQRWGARRWQWWTPHPWECGRSGNRALITAALTAAVERRGATLPGCAIGSRHRGQGRRRQTWARCGAQNRLHRITVRARFHTVVRPASATLHPQSVHWGRRTPR
jgi:hypothetical protein